MSTHRPRLSRRSASRILDDPQARSGDSLSALLAAASAPAQAGELTGEEQALARFQAGAPVPSAAPRARRRVAAPVAALGALGLLVAGGGLAVAASQGALHVPFDGHDNRSDKAPSAPASTNPGLDRTGTPTSAAPSGEASDGATPSSTHAPNGSPSPSLEGLCRAFQAGAAEVNHDNPAFDALAAAAGGEENIATYCVDLIGPSTKPTHPPKPTQAATPTHPPKPTQAATPTKPAKPTKSPRPSKPTQAADPTKPGKPTKAS